MFEDVEVVLDCPEVDGESSWSEAFEIEFGDTFKADGTRCFKEDHIARLKECVLCEEFAKFVEVLAGEDVF